MKGGFLHVSYTVKGAEIKVADLLRAHNSNTKILGEKKKQVSQFFFKFCLYLLRKKKKIKSNIQAY